MTDFLDGELGEFDWGPTTQGCGIASMVRAVTDGATTHTVMMCVGALALVLGLTTAWASYQPIDASPAVPEPPAFLESTSNHGVDAHGVENGAIDARFGDAGSGPEADP